MPVLTHTYGQATLTSTGAAGAALVSVTNAAALTPVTLAAPYPDNALYPSDSLFPDSTWLPSGPGLAVVVDTVLDAHLTATSTGGAALAPSPARVATLAATPVAAAVINT